MVHQIFVSLFKMYAVQLFYREKKLKPSIAMKSNVHDNIHICACKLLTLTASIQTLVIPINNIIYHINITWYNTGQGSYPPLVCAHALLKVTLQWELASSLYNFLC